MDLSRRFVAMPSKRGAAGCRTPMFQFTGLLEDQLEEWSTEIRVPTLLVVLSRFLDLLATNRLPAQDHGDRLLVIDRRFKSYRLRQLVSLLVDHEIRFGRLLLRNERSDAAEGYRCNCNNEFVRHSSPSHQTTD